MPNHTSSTRSVSEIDAWLAGRPAKTRRQYRGDVERFEREAGTTLLDAERADVQGWIDTLREEGGPEGDGLAPATLKRRLSSISSAMRFLSNEGLREGNPAARCRTPDGRSRLSEKILSKRQVRQLCRIGARTAEDRLMLRTIYALALRVSELVALEARDLAPADPEAPERAGLVTLWGKGAKEATLRLEGGPWPLLRSRAEPLAPSGRLFDVSERTVRRRVTAAAKRVGLPEAVSPHWLRHSAGSHMVDAGVPVHEARDFMRHSSVETTSLYLHARPDASPGAVLDA